MNEEVFQAKGDLMKSIQTFLETFNCIPFEEKPQILFQAWEKKFAIQYSKPENPNELFQKLLEDLKELAEYKNSQSRDRPIFLNDDENHSVQNKESLENSSDEIAVSNSNEEKEGPSQEFDIRKLIREECCAKVSEEQKQNMEDTMLELVKIFYDDDFEDIEYVEAPLSNLEIVSVEEENVVHQAENDVNQEEEEVDLEDISQIQDVEQEADLFLASDNSIPPGIENVTNDSEGDNCFLEELFIDDSILSHESSDSNFEDNPSIPRPPPELPNAETDEGEEIPVVMNDKDKFDEDYYFFMIDKVFSFLSAKSEDTIFDPGISA
uniref:Reverse transcriptase domain-containing protein n=1 Tax=Tanacetum cinerariifolium TaxID=118510 RepID=A0A6L2M0U6_TANCI|nr:hypothetical protein [Tanacetum cinerariifolium]